MAPDRQIYIYIYIYIFFGHTTNACGTFPTREAHTPAVGDEESLITGPPGKFCCLILGELLEDPNQRKIFILIVRLHHRKLYRTALRTFNSKNNMYILATTAATKISKAWRLLPGVYRLGEKQRPGT